MNSDEEKAKRYETLLMCLDTLIQSWALKEKNSDKLRQACSYSECAEDLADVLHEIECKKNV